MEHDDCTETVNKSLFVIKDRSSSLPFRVELQVNNRPLSMEVDTGAAVSLAVFVSLLPSTELQPTNVVLKTYTGESIPVLVILPVTVSYGKQRYTKLDLLVVQGTGPSLMGRDWLKGDSVGLEDRSESECC